MSQTSQPLSQNTITFQVLENLRKILKREEMLKVQNLVNKYIHDSEIIDFIQQIKCFFSPIIIEEIKKVVRNEHQAVFHGFADVFLNPNDSEEKQPPKQLPPKYIYTCHCGDCASYILQCSHSMCDSCILDDVLQSSRCKICKRKFKLANLKETFMLKSSDR